MKNSYIIKKCDECGSSLEKVYKYKKQCVVKRGKIICPKCANDKDNKTHITGWEWIST
jgi:formylmethanofuran dehydrogenase subunit E